MKPIDQVLTGSALAIVLGAGLLAANWPSVSGSTARGVVIEDGAGNKLGVAGAPVVVQQITDALNTNFKVATGQLDATSNITYATIPGLSIALAAGKTYMCGGKIMGVSGAVGGYKLALIATGGLTVTSARIGFRSWNGSAINGYTSVGIGVDLANQAAVFTDLELSGAIVVNVAGTINVQGAQSVSNATPTSFFANSNFYCQRVN